MLINGRLTKPERDQIARLHSRQYSDRAIAKKLGRSQSTISSEISRHKRWDGTESKWIYDAIYAQDQSEENQKNSRKESRMDDPWIYRYVTEKLREGWAPEQIEGRLKRNYSSNRSKWIGHSCIYEWIYADEQKNDKWWEYLRRKQKTRKKHHAQWVHKSHIPRRVSISKRSEHIDTREEFGHWEGDTVEGQRQVGDGMRTEVERLSRYVAAVLIPTIDSKETIKVQRELFASLPQEARRTETMDNGREHHLHYELQDSLGMDTYFCHPYASYERGTNENTNGLLREYFPKRTDLRTVTQEELNDVVKELNNRPRKCLDYQTPLEVFTHHCTILPVIGSEV